MQRGKKLEKKGAMGQYQMAQHIFNWILERKDKDRKWVEEIFGDIMDKNFPERMKDI